MAATTPRYVWELCSRDIHSIRHRDGGYNTPFVFEGFVPEIFIQSAINDGGYNTHFVFGGSVPGIFIKFVISDSGYMTIRYTGDNA